jgi:hypothetical protein
MEGQDVVSSDDHKIGTIVAERDGFAIVDMGHVFKTKHAIPTEFLRELEGVQRATVSKQLVSDSPKVEDGYVDAAAVRMHYGLIEVTVVDPDPNELNADADDPRRHSETDTDAPAYDRANSSTGSSWMPADDSPDRDRRLGEPG